MRTYAETKGVHGYGASPGDGGFSEWAESRTDLGPYEAVACNFHELTDKLTDTSTPESQEEFYELCDMFETACQEAGVDPNHVWDSLVTKTRRGPVSRRAEQVLVTLREKLEEDYEEYTPNASV